MILASIAGVHALAVAGLMNMGVRPTVDAPEPLLQAVFLRAESRPVSRPELDPQFVPPALELPRVQVPVIEAPAETAITVAWVKEAPVAAPPAAMAASVVDTSIPVPVQTIDYLEQARPQYPPQARRARAQGTVYLRVIIDPEGRPLEVHIERSSGFELLDHAARAALLKSLFRPYRENGVARSASAIVPVRFSLNSRSS